MAERVTVSVIGFSGMNDVKEAEGFFAKEGIAEPSAILNADVNINGRLVKRTGRTLVKTLTGTHSLWAGLNCMLCAAAGTLYKVVDGNTTSVATISGPEYPLSYAEVDDLVYISTPYWNTVYDPATSTTSAWGLTRPSGPMLTSSSVGSLPVGIYHVCMTNVSGSDISGNGPITTITLSSVGGIQILNRPAGAIVWCTDKNEGVFYEVGAVSNISYLPTTEPLPSFLCSPAPYMTNLCYAFGLMWGSVDNVVYYSQPFRPTWFRVNLNKFTFESNVTIIAKVPTGLFIGMTDKTVFMEGTIPTEMHQKDAGAGSIKGTLVYSNNLPELGDILGTREKGYVNVPTWRTADGIVLGNANGKLFNLTKNKIKLDSPGSGASLYRNVNGTFQFLTSSSCGLSGSSIGELNENTLALFEDGKVSQSEFAHMGQGSTGSVADTVTYTLKRNGEYI